MYGKRARIGLIVPASNTVCEPECARLVPEGVAVYAARVLFEPTLEGLQDMRDQAWRAAHELASESISNLILFCCTVGSMMGGPEADQELAGRIEKETGVPTTTTTTAVRAALGALGLTRIAVATPYTKEINALERELLQAMGYQVTGMAGVYDGVAARDFRNDMIGCLSPEVAWRKALRVNGKENEGIFISCTNFRAIDVIERLERDTGKPVVTSNQAGIWYALRMLGIHEEIAGYGQLMKQELEL